MKYIEGCGTTVEFLEFVRRKRFDTPITIELSNEVVTNARQFANSVVSTIDYSDSNQCDKRKIAEDHFISKLGEEAVKQLFISRNALVDGPDYTIYNAKEKSWNSDLLINGYHVSVKTQSRSNAEKYGLSWMFQQSTSRRDPILNQPEAWVCFVECDDTHAFQCTVYPPKRIKQLEFKPPRLAHLIGKKQVVYAEDLKC